MVLNNVGRGQAVAKDWDDGGSHFLASIEVEHEIEWL